MEQLVMMSVLEVLPSATNQILKTVGKHGTIKIKLDAVTGTPEQSADAADTFFDDFCNALAITLSKNYPCLSFSTPVMHDDGHQTQLWIEWCIIDTHSGYCVPPLANITKADHEAELQKLTEFIVNKYITDNGFSGRHMPHPVVFHLEYAYKIIDTCQIPVLRSSKYEVESRITFSKETCEYIRERIADVICDKLVLELAKRFPDYTFEKPRFLWDYESRSYRIQIEVSLPSKHAV
jgi:hypothetical protein